jgi:enoyl-CoA hydratase/carnithine racemase
VQQLPLKVAMGMLVTGRQISAAEAYQIGLVNEVVPLEGLIQAAERWAAEIKACAPIAVQLTKASAMACLNMSVDDALEDDERSGWVARLLKSADFREGPLAFAEKRRPVWAGC